MCHPVAVRALYLEQQTGSAAERAMAWHGLPHRPHRLAVLIHRPVISCPVGLDDLNPERLGQSFPRALRPELIGNEFLALPL
jgi:hypothetical protein